MSKLSQTYRVLFEPTAWEALMKLPARDQDRVATLAENLELRPRPEGAVKLSGGGNLYRVRAGAYRVIYTIQDATVTVVVIKIGHRREVYKARN